MRVPMAALETKADGPGAGTHSTFRYSLGSGSYGGIHILLMYGTERNMAQASIVAFANHGGLGNGGQCHPGWHCSSV